MAVSWRSLAGLRVFALVLLLERLRLQFQRLQLPLRVAFRPGDALQLCLLQLRKRLPLLCQLLCRVASADRLEECVLQALLRRHRRPLLSLHLVDLLNQLADVAGAKPLPQSV